MSLMKSRQPKTYRWQKGDLISAREACGLLGYQSARNLQDAARRKNIEIEFARLSCPLTLDIYIGGSQRFLRSEFDAFLTAKIEAAQKKQVQKNGRDLRLAA